MYLLISMIAVLGTISNVRSSSLRILGGHDAKEGQFPYMASLQYYGQHSCGACIINEYWILTASHCIKGLLPVEVIIMTNSIHQFGPGDYYEVEKIVPHENLRTDIGLVKVTQPIVMGPNVKPIELSTDPLLGVETVTLTGWGRIHFPKEITPYVLQTADFQTISNERCKAFNSKISNITLCTLAEPGKGTCFGDSGGPLTYKGRVAGIVSSGYPCAKGLPDFYTRVASFVDWINEKIKNN